MFFHEDTSSWTYSDNVLGLVHTLVLLWFTANKGTS